MLILVLEMNPFDTLSEYDIHKICSYLPGRSLLSLSLADQKFNRIIGSTRKTMAKIRLVVNLEHDEEFDAIIEAVGKRRFTALKLENDFSSLAQPCKFSSLLTLLSGTVEDLVIGHMSIEKNQLSKVIRMFLPKLKACTLDSVKINYEASNALTSSNDNTNYPLEALTLKRIPARVVKFFNTCKQLLSFEHVESAILSKDLEALTDFLAPQTRLRILTFDSNDFDWSRMTCYHLEELKISYEDSDDAGAISEFLSKQHDLKKLELELWGCRHPLMKAVCNVPKLDSLSLTILDWPYGYENDVDGNDEPFDVIVNFTVKSLRIHDESDATGDLLKMFRGIETVDLKLGSDMLDLSDVPYKTIEMIELDDSSSELYVDFSPLDDPENLESFESAVLSFAGKYPSRVTGIRIGYMQWCRGRVLKMSNSFCEQLVDLLPELKEFEVFNIADHNGFLSFVDANHPNLRYVRAFP